MLQELMMKPDNLYVIGLTGNIACGKSSVVAIINQLGARTLDADQVTHRLQQPGTRVYHQIIARFGNDVLIESNGPIDRKKLGSIVFSNPQALKELEHIVHPAVQSEVKTWLLDVSSRANTKQIAMIDAIKLLESGWKSYCDAIWVVTSLQDQQIRRLMKTRGMTEQEATCRIMVQSSQESKISQADVVLDNSGTLASLREQVETAWGQILHTIQT
jgi:dephospho-CoA kinase